MSTKETILAAKDKPVKKIHVKEWKCDVYLRTLSGKETFQYQEMASKLGGDTITGDNATALFAGFAALVLGDKDGERVFTDEDAPALAEKSFAALDFIFQAGSEYNKLRVSDVNELEKNSETAPTPASGGE